MKRPTTTATMKTARFCSIAAPVFAITGAARPKTPTGAVHRIQPISFVRASPRASAKDVRVRCFSLGSVVVAAARRTTKMRRGEQRPVGGDLNRIPGDEVDQEVHDAHTGGLQVLYGRRRRHGRRERQGEAHHPHPDQDRRQRRRPEEAHGESPQPTELPQVADSPHADEDDRRHQGDDDHLDRAQEDLPEWFDRLGGPQQRRRTRRRRGDSEPQAERQADENGACVHRSAGVPELDASTGSAGRSTPTNPESPRP